MSSESGTQWRHFLEEQTSFLDRGGCKLPSHICDQKTFREAFESTCKSHKEKYITRLSGKVYPSFIDIIEFATSIDKSCQDLGPKALEALVWSASFELIEVNHCHRMRWLY